VVGTAHSVDAAQPSSALGQAAQFFPQFSGLMLCIWRTAARSSSEMTFMTLSLSATKMFMVFSTLMKGSQEFLPAETFRLSIPAFLASEGTFPHF
jgi:hypothetical protein